jgi:hypothetical protein
MNTFKITNITNSIGKREPKHNAILDVEYVDHMVKKTIRVKPGNTVYLTVDALPLSVHRLRVKGLVVVEEISATELAKLTKQAEPPKPKPEEKKGFFKNIKKVIEHKIEEDDKKSDKKKVVKKEEKKEEE